MNFFRIVVFSSLIILAGCSDKTEPVVAPIPTTLAPAALPVPEAIAAPSQPHQVVDKKQEVNPDWLARLQKAVNRVEFRQRNDSIWKSAEVGNHFVRFDALQTQGQSSAQVAFESGSNLEVKDNTLLVFDHDPGKTKTTEDRVIVKNGGLVGTTRSELWIFTNAGLVQIKSDPKLKKAAKARVSIQENQKLNVKVDSGTAEVVFKGKEKIEKVKVSANSEFQVTSNMKFLSEDGAPSPAKIEEIVNALKVTKFSRADLIVEQPVDGMISEQPEYTIKGQLTGADAKLLINGELAVLEEGYSFNKKINLQPGSNLIVFQLIRSDASVQFMRRTIRLQAGK